MKTAQRSHRARSGFRANRSLLMLGIIVLDCGILLLCILVCGLIMSAIR